MRWKCWTTKSCHGTDEMDEGDHGQPKGGRGWWVGPVWVAGHCTLAMFVGYVTNVPNFYGPFMCVCVCVYVCTYVSMYICMYVSYRSGAAPQEMQSKGSGSGIGAGACGVAAEAVGLSNELRNLETCLTIIHIFKSPVLLLQT